MAEDKGFAHNTRKISDTSAKEESVQQFWKEKNIFQKSLEQAAPNGEFVFYDGPPFATGLPHFGHILGSTSKDVFGRYKTMRGYKVERRWGWDCHGLPIETKVESKLKLKNKKEILTLGIEKFNEEARGLVLEFIHEWKRYIERLGRFVDFDNSYKTMDASFSESVWFALAKLHKEGNIYQGNKVLMYCTHCETPLAKAEVVMDGDTYKDVTEESATVAFKVIDPSKHSLPENTYLLAWTTTPWTLPGNVALAVGAEIEYGLYEKDGRHYVLAVERAQSYDFKEAVKVFTGASLAGIVYEPLYVIDKVAQFAGKKWQVLVADFVTTTDGTGIVHTAVIYGEDDFTLGVQEKLPMIPLLNPNGTYTTDAPEFLHGQFIKKGSPLILADLESRQLLYVRNAFTHSIPHCYRCGTPLIYNAVSSWFISIQQIKEKLLSENEKINWIPSHLKEGRFKHIVETAPDWTISRNRFWATPLPFWKTSEGGVVAVGSYEELRKRTKRSGNTYHIMRHGEAEHNVLGITNCDRTIPIHLTDKGRLGVQESAKKLKDANIDLVFVSPFMRTQETVEVVRETLGLSTVEVIVDERLRELELGVFGGKSLDEWYTTFGKTDADEMKRFDVGPEGGENLLQVKKRMGEFLYDIEARYAGKNILIVSHGDPLWMLKAAAGALSKEASVELGNTGYLNPAQCEPLDFVPLPHNADYEFDVHIPYIDRITVLDDAGKPMTRTSEVVDCWVESGSMPFAQYNYPHSNKEVFERRTPAHFISEYIAQTRTWFYYTHALSVLLFGHRAFENVVTTGTVLAKDGEKMSKSKGNFSDPMDLIDVYGADALRFQLMNNVLMQAEDYNFREEDLKETHGKIVVLLRNVLAFFMMYDGPQHSMNNSSSNVLDVYILDRLARTIKGATFALDAYEVNKATRLLREFIDDLSTWYVRRSRDRVKTEASAMLSTLRYVLYHLAHCLAPLTPFIAEDMFQATKESDAPESVHLSKWVEPAYAEHDELLSGMTQVREYASAGLRMRQEANIKVRQPLASFSITGALTPELESILKDEINVQTIIQNAKELALDTVLTPELIVLGDEREKSRAVADARKQLGLLPKDEVTVSYGEGPFSVTLSTGTIAFNVVKNAS
jgi:isoleucyl-tRNA synthetase